MIEDMLVYEGKKLDELSFEEVCNYEKMVMKNYDRAISQQLEIQHQIKAVIDIIAEKKVDMLTEMKMGLNGRKEKEQGTLEIGSIEQEQPDDTK